MPDPLRIAICEDTKSDEEQLLNLLSQSDIETSCTVFPNGEALLRVYQPQEFDLLLTDIYMDGMTGVETVAKIREIDETVPVAFITTSPDFALESYRLSVLKYIEKPFKKKDIEDILDLAQMKREHAPSLLLRKNGTELKIRFSQILYLEQQTHQLIIYLRNHTVEQLRDKLSSHLPELEAHHFFQPHKSFSVNMSFVRSINPELRCFVMQDGKNIPIRRESMSKAKKALKEYLFNRTRSATP